MPCIPCSGQVMASHGYSYAFAGGGWDSEDTMAAQWDAETKLLHKQQDLAEVTGIPGPKELELLLSGSTVSLTRQWAVEHWKDPQAYSILQAWATEILRQEEQPGAMSYKVFQPGETYCHFTVTWCLAKLMHCHWCVNSWPKDHSTGDCYCLTATSFMPAGCTHRQSCSQNQKFPQSFCDKRSKCLRCNKYLEAVG